MLRGIPVSEGIGIGRAYVIGKQEIKAKSETVTDPENEKKRFHDAVDAFCVRTEKLAQKMEESVAAKEAEIIRGHMIMLQDPYMISQVEEKIDAGVCAESACSEILDMFMGMFSAAEDELIRQRVADIEDIKSRLLQILSGNEGADLSEIPCGSILVTEELTPSMTAEMNSENIAGIVTEKGGMTSHSAILTRSLELPAVLSVPGALEAIADGMTVIVDGSEGEVLAEPDEETLKAFDAKQQAFASEKRILARYRGKSTVTADGLRKEVCCNIGSVKDAVAAAEKDGEGIGLFRTEFLFMESDSAPDEEKQFEVYKKTVQLFKGKSVIIRTLDAGGDKGIEYLGMKKEENPFLGFRAIRYCLDDGRQVFETQLRALVRASAFGNIKVMIPLVTNVEEIRSARKMTAEIMEEFDREGITYDKDMQIGIMVETPAACMLADVLAKESDFFSIGTNDLTQYTMAADRGNPQVAYLNNTYQPAVLRAVRHIIKSARSAGIPVGMCGEAAADPLLTPLLISFGLDEFSVNPTSVLRTRYNISKWNGEAADAVAEKAMALTTADEVKKYLKEACK